MITFVTTINKKSLLLIDSEHDTMLPLSMSSMGDAGDVFSLGGELLELADDLLLLLLLLLFICWLRRLVCCSRREWILLLPSALLMHMVWC